MQFYIVVLHILTRSDQTVELTDNTAAGRSEGCLVVHTLTDQIGQLCPRRGRQLLEALIQLPLLQKTHRQLTSITVLQLYCNLYLSFMCFVYVFSSTEKLRHPLKCDTTGLILSILTLSSTDVLRVRTGLGKQRVALHCQYIFSFSETNEKLKHILTSAGLTSTSFNGQYFDPVR